MKANLSPSALMLKEIAKTEPLKREHEARLFDEYEKSSSSRRRAIKLIIIESNLRFVLNVALNYKYSSNATVPDLFSEGKIGLIIGFEKFDKTSGNRLISYAVWWIRQRITKYLEENDLIRLPSHHKTQLLKAKKTMDFDEHTYYLHELTSHHTSLDSMVKSDSTLSITEVIKDDKIEDLDKKHLHERLKTKLNTLLSNTLKEEEIIVLVKLYGIGDNNPLALREVEEIIGKCHERVRQIRDTALRKLRKTHGVGKLKELLYSVTNDQ